jgi:hypothetical protein
LTATLLVLACGYSWSLYLLGNSSHSLSIAACCLWMFESSRSGPRGWSVLLLPLLLQPLPYTERPTSVFIPPIYRVFPGPRGFIDLCQMPTEGERALSHVAV